ncbi:MAG: type II toxin-antitoxin system RelE/ParE family toxin [Hyphomicrobiales bacterium]|nr:type II toxin-antitoxin system RelE/ParE family toxin [Hyphomicrobiales bacterium]MBV9519744.1 type II toxin-antitoxin system RelE/ParE family toxin [Hyphomicrobiales bacterium]
MELSRLGEIGGRGSVRVNRQWRSILSWEGSRGEAQGVYLDDHSYR